MKSIVYIICISLIGLLCIGGCTRPASETWKGYRVAEDCPADVSVPRPKIGKVERTEMYYRSTVWYHSLHLPNGEVMCTSIRSSSVK